MHYRKGAPLQIKVIRGRALAALAALALVVGVSAGGASAKSNHATAGVTVYAAASLTDVFPKIDPWHVQLRGSLRSPRRSRTVRRRTSSRPRTRRSRRSSCRGHRRSLVFTRNTRRHRAEGESAEHQGIYDVAKPGVKIDINSAVPVGAYAQIWKQMGLTAR
jgi:hypothetical protein